MAVRQKVEERTCGPKVRCRFDKPEKVDQYHPGALYKENEMIHGTWQKDDQGYWAVRIPKDRYWCGRTPEELDRVMVHRRDGSFEEILIVGSPEDHVDYWLCTVYDERYIGCEDYDMYDIYEMPH